MSDPAETSDNVRTAAHSEGEADPIRTEPEGSDVGGPAQTTESTTESALDRTSTVGHDNEPDDPQTNPL